MDGILIIDKPDGITSHDVVSRVRRLLKTKRVGHTGTLDPFATGVMVILVGQATRLAQFLDKDEKEYEAIVRFGFETDTGDRTGSQKSQVPSPNSLTLKDVEAILPEFSGDIEQLPPMYSAKKIDGKKLYESARKGIEVDRKPVNIRISKIEIMDNSRMDHLELGTWDLGLRIACSAGTYIRTLAEDIGQKVGTGAHLAELRRTRAGQFELSESNTLDRLAESEDPTTFLLDMAEAVSHLRTIELTDDRVEKTRNGLSTRIYDADYEENEKIQMLNRGGKLVAIGEFDAEDNTVQPKVVLV